MKGLIKITIAIFSMVLVHILLSKDVPEILKEYNIPTSFEVQELIEQKVDEHLKHPTISLSSDIIGSIFYVGNTEMVENGFLVENIETELTITNFGEFGVEINLKSIRPSKPNTKIDRDNTTTRVDSSSKIPKVVFYDIIHKKRIYVDNNWIVIDRGTSHSYLSIVNMIDNTKSTNSLLEIVFDKEESLNPIISIKLLNIRPPTESDKVTFDFGKDKKFVYSATTYKATRSGINY